MISIIIVNFNSGDRLRECAERLRQQSCREFEIIIIDNCSTDSSLNVARAEFPDATIIESPVNLGFAAANNRAVERAQGEWLVFLNPDAYPEPDWLSELQDGARRFPFADAFGSTQIIAASPDRLDGAGDMLHVLGVPYRGHHGWPTRTLPPADGECFSPCAAAAMYRAETFRALGGFDERFFCYSEDVDLGFRLRLTGGCAIQLAKARTLHEGSGISGRISEFTVYHGNRNRIWTMFKNTPGLIYWPLAPLRIVADLLLCARAFLAGSGLAAVRGIFDGYSQLARFSEDRRRLQASRTANIAAIARALTWSPVNLLTRRAVVKSIVAMKR